MFDNTFYHEIVRKTVVSFGTLFNSLYIVRTNNQGVVTQRMKVPLAYGPKQKFLVRLEQDPQRQGTKTYKSLNKFYLTFNQIIQSH